MAENSPEGDNVKEDKSGGEQLGVQVAKNARFLAVLAMENAPTWARILVFVCYAIFALSLVVLVTPPYDANKQIIVLSITIISLLVLVVIMLNQFKRVVMSEKLRNPRKVDEIKKGSDITGLTPVDYDRAISLLTQIRANIFHCLSRHQSDVSISKIRANLFLPQKSNDGPDYVLKIYPGLHVNMDKSREREISFGPGEGLTGRVFEDGKPRVAERIPSEAKGWDSSYTLTDDQLSRIHPKLQWILSIPLKHDNTPIGVVNIDGLQEDVHVDALYGCIHNIFGEIATMQELLSRNTAFKEARS
ncbi:MAG: GAF domain-containing protein [Proteobacteria bacterium]|nr:GAF domain-containing protein [Pseudomonadota bacterium]